MKKAINSTHTNLYIIYVKEVDIMKSKVAKQISDVGSKLAKKISKHFRKYEPHHQISLDEIHMDSNEPNKDK